MLIFINLISRARVSFVYSSLSLIIIIVVRKLYERRGRGLRKEFFLLILVSTATVDGVDRVEEVGNEVCPSEHTRLLRAWTLRVLRGAGWGVEERRITNRDDASRNASSVTNYPSR